MNVTSFPILFGALVGNCFFQITYMKKHIIRLFYYHVICAYNCCWTIKQWMGCYCIVLTLPVWRNGQLSSKTLLTFSNDCKNIITCFLTYLYNFITLHLLIGPAAFRPRVHATSVYSSSVELGRPVLQGLLAVDIIAKEVVYPPKKILSFPSNFDYIYLLQFLIFLPRFLDGFNWCQTMRLSLWSMYAHF
jgi:hypothetical protein